VALIESLVLSNSLSDDDRMTHLLGSSRLVNTINEVAASGGLGEAAAWVALRQNIYVCLTINAPLNLDLDCYKASTSFIGVTDHAWVNKIVYVFAEILRYSCQPAEFLTSETWLDLNQATEDWFQTKPDTFNPLLAIRYPTPTDAGDRRVFPEILMLQAPHVIGMVYYHLSHIVLASTDPHKTRVGFGAVWSWRETENTLRSDLKAIVGLAISNPHVPAANFEASHILHACGHCLRSQAERQAALDFLHSVTERIGWRVQHIVDHLREYWQG
jgi:hypothetical protein